MSAISMIFQIIQKYFKKYFLQMPFLQAVNYKQNRKSAPFSKDAEPFQ